MSLVPTTRRPIPLRRRVDLVVSRETFRGVAHWVVKDPLGLKYHRLQPQQWAVLELLDGRRSLDELREALQRRYPAAPIEAADVQRLVGDLHDKGLALSDRPGQASPILKKRRERRRKKGLSWLANVLYLKLPGWDPQRMLDVGMPAARWLFHPATAIAAALFVASAWGLMAMRFREFSARLPEFEQFFGWPNLIWLWVVLGGAKIVHEFGHAFSCRHFRRECHEMGVLLLIFSPCLYCDVTDSWMIPRKWPRIVIGGAGMYVESILSAAALWLWWFTQPGLFNHLCLDLFFVTSITTVLFNANPLVRFDGYFMLADWLEIPNLRQRADQLFQETFSKHCLGMKVHPDPFRPETGTFWFVTYAAAAAIYRWVVMFGILYFLATVLKPYGLQSLGLMAATLSLGLVVGGLFWKLGKILTSPRSEPLSKPRIAMTLAGLGTIVALIALVPIAWHVEGACLVEPEGAVHVYNPLPGRLVEIAVAPGESVAAGDLLLRLVDEELEQRHRELRSQFEKQRILAKVEHALGENTRHALALERLRDLAEQLDESQTQLELLEIRAPIAGTVVAPPRTEERSETEPLRLGTWTGTPLDRENADALLEQRTHLLSLAPDARHRAVIFVDQADREDVSVGQTVEMKLDLLPERTLESRVESFAERHAEFVPAALSNKHGGPLPTVTDASGQERLASTIAYQATASLAGTDLPLLTGVRGAARFRVAHRSLGAWLWRAARRTLRFRI